MATYYSTVSDSATTARAYGRDLDCSPKSGRNVARAIKGMPVARAKEFLQAVSELKTPVPFKVRFRKIHHRRGQGFGPGKYPVGTVTRFLKLLESAEANAEYKGLDKDRLVIVHASAYQGTVNKAFTPRAQGRATPHFNRRCNFEVIVSQSEETEETERPARGRAKPAAKGRKGEKATGKTEAKHEGKGEAKHEAKGEKADAKAPAQPKGEKKEA